MPASKRFNLLVVRGDGTRVLRLSFPRWAAIGALVGAVVWTVLAAAVLGLVGDYALLRQQRQVLEAFLPRMAEQQARFDLYQDRIRELRGEVDGWRELHARIWA